MIDYEYFDLFNADSVDKQFYIEYAGGTITNEELFSDSIEITEKLCSEDTLRFGSCESNYIKFKVAGIYNLEENSEITVSVSLSEDKSDPFIDNPRTSDRFVIGKYYVKDNTLTADRMWREVTAYDAMHYIINADVTDWYNGILPEKDSEVSLWQFRKSFAQHFGLEEVVPAGGLINDNMTVKRTIDPEQINGKDVLTAICEINGCFGHIGRDGKLHYIYLEQNIQGLYPANNLYPGHAPEHLPQSKTGHLYPQDPKPVPTIAKDKNYIEPPEYEDYLVKWITHVQIRGSENDAGYTYPAGNITENDNLYVISDNFLVYGKTDAEMQQITSRLLSKITDITYRPYRLKVRANPCLELGDPIRVNTDYHVIESYVLQRTMSGIQAFYDSLYAKGTKKCEENTNSAQRAIIQLKGKTNELTRTSEETRSELKDLESETESRFVQTAESIEAEVTRAKNAENTLSGRITLTAEQLQTSLTNTQNNLQSQITQTAGQISQKVSSYDFESYKTQTDMEISQKVSSGDVVSEINQSPDKIVLNSNRLVVNSTNFALDESGRCFIKDSLRFETDAGKTEIITHDGRGYPVLTNVRIDIDSCLSLNGYKIISEVHGDNTSGVYNSIYKDGTSIRGSKISYSDLADKLKSSDIRLKKDINNLPDMEDVYMAFIPVEYFFKDGLKEYSKKRQYGLIAQYTEETLFSNRIYDSAIVYKKKSAEDLNETAYTDGETYKIDYEQLHAMHVQMIQKHQKKINALEETVKELVSRIERLESGMIGG